MSIKEGDMVSIRQDFINRYKNVQESIIKAMDKALERAIGNKVIDFEKCEEQLSRRDKACSGYQFLPTYKKKEMSSIKNAKILL